MGTIITNIIFNMLVEKLQRKKTSMVSSKRKPTADSNDLINPFKELKEITADIVSKNIHC